MRFTGIQSAWLVLSLLLLLAPAARAQVLTGTIVEGKSRAAVPYANLGIPGKNVGTVADGEGRYQLTYSAANLNDTVRVSSIGYGVRRVLLRELLPAPTVVLAAEAVALGEVRVKAKGLFRHNRTLGNTGNSTSTTLTLSAHDLGAEVGTVISLRHRPTKVLSATFNVAENQAGLLRFRVNLYRLGADGKPSATKLLPRDILLTTSVSTGPITVDLTAHQLILDEDFFLALEWIGGGNARQVSNQLAFSASLGYAKNELYQRETSQGDWVRASAGAALAGLQPRLSFYVTVLD